MNQETFQKKFEEPPTAKQQKVHVKMYDKYKLKIFLVFFVSLLAIFGLIMVIRGYFLSNPPEFNDTGVYATIYKTFFPNTGTRQINEPDDEQGQVTVSTVQQINTPFTPKYTKEKIWLILRNGNETFIGFLTDKDKFNYVYRVPLNSENIRLFINESIVYFSNAAKVNELSTFVMKEKSSKNIFTYTLQEGESFYSVYYEPSNQSFYYTYTDETRATYVNAINLANNQFPLYQTNFLVGKTTIEYVDIGQNLVYLENGNHCYMLSVQSKNLLEIGCEYVKRNDDGILFWTNSSGLDSYAKQFAGEIYESYQNDKLREIIADHLNNGSNTILKPSDDLRRIVYSDALGTIFTNLAYNENTLYFVTNKLVQTTPVSWIPRAQSIEKIVVAPSDIKKVTVATVLPKTKVYSLIPVGSELYAIVEGDYLGHQKLEKYYPNGTTVYYPLVLPPTSYPQSYPTSYSVTEYWKEVPLNLVELETIELIAPTYFL